MFYYCFARRARRGVPHDTCMAWLAWHFGRHDRKEGGMGQLVDGQMGGGGWMDMLWCVAMPPFAFPVPAGMCSLPAYLPPHPSQHEHATHTLLRARNTRFVPFVVAISHSSVACMGLGVCTRMPAYCLHLRCFPPPTYPPSGCHLSYSSPVPSYPIICFSFLPSPASVQVGLNLLHAF